MQLSIQRGRRSNGRRPKWRRRVEFAILAGALTVSSACRADMLSSVQLLREVDCGGRLRAAEPLHRSALLDRAAQDWAVPGGLSPSAAAERRGYDAEITAGVHVAGAESAAVRMLRRSSCRTLSDPALHDIGLYQRGSDTWLVLAAPYIVPGSDQAPMQSSRVLQLVNEARARGTRCGERAFAPAPPVTLSRTLAGVALGHASDMARHAYLEHNDRAGRTPADRVRAAGYREQLVGENIAYGPQSADEVVRGWLESPGHCENIMDPRFAEMGVAFAAGVAPKHGLYWVQVLVDPYRPGPSSSG